MTEDSELRPSRVCGDEGRCREGRRSQNGRRRRDVHPPPRNHLRGLAKHAVPEPHGQRVHARPLLAQAALVVYGEEYWRPYIHARDAATAIRTVVEAESEVVAGSSLQRRGHRGELSQGRPASHPHSRVSPTPRSSIVPMSGEILATTGSASTRSAAGGRLRRKDRVRRGHRPDLGCSGNGLIWHRRPALLELTAQRATAATIRPHGPRSQPRDRHWRGSRREHPPPRVRSSPRSGGRSSTSSADPLLVGRPGWSSQSAATSRSGAAR